MMTRINLLAIASSLVSEDGENVEYDRAVAEMTSEILGVHMDDKSVVARLIGVTGKALDALEDVR